MLHHDKTDSLMLMLMVLEASCNANNMHFDTCQIYANVANLYKRSSALKIL